ncbi:MAG: ABC transporter substrate-binding protein [Fastidiosipilaceae bacterium]|nr:ABC transporter substrate-binding protein [Clostridiaceae bacterium]
MKAFFRKMTGTVALVIALAIPLTACGGGNKDTAETTAKTEETVTDDTTETAGDPSTEETTVETATGEPKMGGEVVLAVAQEPDSLDPYLAAAAGTKEIIYNFYEGLVKLMPDSTFEDCLSTSHEVSEDGLEYIFQIREGVKFHNGEEMGPADVVYSLRRGAGLDSADGTPLIGELGIIDTIEEVEGENAVKITLSEPDADFITYLTAAIIPEGYEDQAKQPIGTGPFVFDSYETQQHVKMVRFDDYWRERPAYLDSVIFRIVPSADSAMVDLQAGKIDIFPYLTMDKADLVADKYDFIESDSNMVQLWALNSDRAPFDDVRVRQAMDMAVDKQMLLDGITFGQGTILESGMAPSMGEFYNKTVNETRKYDPEQARALLADAGYNDDLTITITVPGNYVIHVQTAEMIAAMLAEVGVTADIQSVDWGTWLNNVYEGRDYDSTVIALTFDYCAPSTVLGRYSSTASNNFVNFNSAEYDSIYAETQTEQDHAKRVADYQRLQDILSEEAASVFLQNPGVQTAVSKELGGYTTYPMYVQDMYNVYFK